MLCHGLADMLSVLGAFGPSCRGEAFIYRPFGTWPLPTGASEASPHGEAFIYRPFGTWTLPTGISEASRRGEGGLCRLFGTEAGADIRSGLQPGLMEAGSKEVTWTFEVIN